MFISHSLPLLLKSNSAYKRDTTKPQQFTATTAHAMFHMCLSVCACACMRMCVHVCTCLCAFALWHSFLHIFCKTQQGETRITETGELISKPLAVKSHRQKDRKTAKKKERKQKRKKKRTVPFSVRETNKTSYREQEGCIIENYFVCKKVIL